MMKLFFISAVLILTSILPVESNENAATHKEYVFQCGALYSVLYQMYKEANKDDEYKMYFRKFKELEIKSVTSFEKNGRSKSRAEEYMQSHIDKIVELILVDSKSAKRFLPICDRLFP